MNNYSCEINLDGKIKKLEFDNSKRIIRNLEIVDSFLFTFNIKVFRNINKE